MTKKTLNQNPKDISLDEVLEALAPKGEELCKDVDTFISTLDPKIGQAIKNIIKVAHKGGVIDACEYITNYYENFGK